MYRIGVDLGGTNIAVGVVNEELKIIGRGKVKTKAPRPAAEIFDDIALAVELAVKDAGISMEVIKYFTGRVPILGICLGHQAIGEVFGGKVIEADKVMHGKVSKILLRKECALFKGLKQEIEVARYHSLIIEKQSLPDDLEIVAIDEDGEIMAIKHKETHTYGLQFHPESILTNQGKEIIKNFLEVC